MPASPAPNSTSTPSWATSRTLLVRPAALSERGAADLIAEGLGKRPEAGFAAACLTATAGVPFLLRELVRSLAVDRVDPVDAAAASVGEQGPATVARATLLRMAKLSAEAVTVARAIAVLGPAAEPHRIATLTGIDHDRASAAADSLATANLLTDDRPLRFSHSIVRTAVYRDLGAGERAAAHARVAELLSAEGAELDAVAAHLLLSAPARRAQTVERLQAAARRAIAGGAPSTAAAYLRRALEEGALPESRAALLLELARAEATMAAPGAAEHFEQAQQLSTDPVLRARAGYAVALIAVLQGDWERSFNAAEHALATLNGEDRELAVVLESFVVALSSLDPRHAHEFEAHREPLRAALRDGVTTAGRGAVVLAAVDTQRAAHLDEAVELVERGLDGGHLLAVEESRSFVAMAASVLMYHERLDASAAVLDELLGAARDAGSVSTTSWAPRFAPYSSRDRVISSASKRTSSQGSSVLRSTDWP